MAVNRYLEYYPTGNSAIRSADPENPCLEPNMEWIGCTVCEIFAFQLNCDLEIGVPGHLRSLKVAPLDRPTPITHIRTKHHVDRQTGKLPVAKLWPFLYIQYGRQPSLILSNRK